MYISYVGIRNPYLLSVDMWVCGKMNQEELRAELGDEEYFEMLEARQSRWEGMDR